jgi:hypothetical protein
MGPFATDALGAPLSTMSAVPRELTPASSATCVVMGQSPTLDGLFNYVVGQLLQMQGHSEAERFRGLEVDHQLELGGRLNR